MSSRRRQGQALSPAAAPLDDDDLLSEILLRLPPQPSFLSRASLVCKRWRRLVSDPGFFRRFRLRHRRNPPLLGFFDRYDCRPFVPTLEALNRVSPWCFSLQRGGSEFFFSLGCRHGLVLIFLPKLLQVIVWDPINGDQHRLAIPPGIKFPGGSPIGGAVVRAAGDVHHFQVVLVGISDKHTRAVASAYSSETNVWSDLITTPLPASSLHSSEGSPMSDVLTKISTDMPAVLVEDSLYWRLTGTSSSILQFDLDRKSLAVIHVPVLVNLYGVMNGYFSVMRADGGGLGCLLLSEFSIQLWKRKFDCDGVASWVLGRTIEMDKLLSLDYKEILSLTIAGFAEDNNVALIWTGVGLFMIQLESLQFRKLLKSNMSVYHPFESVYCRNMHWWWTRWSRSFARCIR